MRGLPVCLLSDAADLMDLLVILTVHQDRVTKERIAEAEERIRKAEEKSASGVPQNGNDDATADADESSTNGVNSATEGVEKLSVANGSEDKTEA